MYYSLVGLCCVLLTQVGNDATFSSLSAEEQNQRNNLDKFSSASFWKGLPVRDGFKEKVQLVLPAAWDASFADSSKKAILAKIVPFLKKVVTASENPTDPCSLTDLDISGKDKWDILSLFIKHEASTYLSDNRTASQNRKAAISALISMNGTVCEQVVLLTTALPTADALQDNDESDVDSDVE